MVPYHDIRARTSDQRQAFLLETKTRRRGFRARPETFSSHRHASEMLHSIERSPRATSFHGLQCLCSPFLPVLRPSRRRDGVDSTTTWHLEMQGHLVAAIAAMLAHLTVDVAIVIGPCSLVSTNRLPPRSYLCSYLSTALKQSVSAVQMESDRDGTCRPE